MKNKLKEYSKVQFDEYREPIIKNIDGKDFLFTALADAQKYWNKVI